MCHALFVHVKIVRFNVCLTVFIVHLYVAYLFRTGLNLTPICLKEQPVDDVYMH